MSFCPFCNIALDHADRCSNPSCFMWFTLVPLPDMREPSLIMQNMSGEIVFIL